MSCPVLCSIAAVSSDGYCLQHSEHPAPEHSGWYVPVEDVCCVWVVGCTRSRAATPVLWGLKSSKGQRSTLNESISQPRVSTPIFELHPQLITHRVSFRDVLPMLSGSDFTELPQNAGALCVLLPLAGTWGWEELCVP